MSLENSQKEAVKEICLDGEPLPLELVLEKAGMEPAKVVCCVKNAD